MSEPDVKKAIGVLLIFDKTRKGKKTGGLVAKFWEDGKPRENAGQLSDYVPTDKVFHGKRVNLYRQGNEVICIELEDATPIHGTVPEKVDVVVTKAPPPEPMPEKKKTKAVKSGSNTTYPLFLPETKLPENTIEAMGGLKDIDNFHLKFNHAALFADEPGTKKGKDKKFQLIQTNDNDVAYKMTANFGHTDFDAIAARIGRLAASLGFDEASLVKLRAKSTWCWAVGLGNASVYENGMTLHHVFGIPYLPGSGLKGMLRNWILRECFGHEKGFTVSDKDALQKAETSALQNEVFVHLFGHGNLGKTFGQVGKATFFDAFPTQKPCVAVDIVNNHFGDYYAAKKVNGTDAETPPADWLQPVPVFFMNVKGGDLQFHIGIENGDAAIGEAGMQLCPDRLKGAFTAQSTYTDFVKVWLSDALAHSGIGAKTAVGYGRMHVQN